MDFTVTVKSQEEMDSLVTLMDKYVLGLKPMYPRVYSYKVNENQMVVSFDKTDGIKMAKIFNNLGHEVIM